MNINDFGLVGQCIKRLSWTDAELKTICEIQPLIIAYMEERKDAGIILSKLRTELDTFEDMWRERQIIRLQEQRKKA